VSILDPALLRPGRFEFTCNIPYPDAEARREIIKIYDKKMGLKMPPETVDTPSIAADHIGPGAGGRHAVQRRPSQRPVPGDRPEKAA